MNSQNDNDLYFVNKPADERAGILLSKADNWFKTMDTNGYLDRVRTLYHAYHGTFFDEAHNINFGGEQGEIVQIGVNHIRNIGTILLNMITATRPAMQARSINTDYKSLVQTKLANGLLDYYMRDHKLEEYLKTAVEYALSMGSGYIKMEWNATSGEVYDYNEELGVYIKEGDLYFSNLSVYDVYFDIHRENKNHDWVLCRSYKNRYDLKAKYPEMGDKILRLPTKDKLDRFSGMITQIDDSDQIAVYEFFHKRTDSVPNGKYHLFLSEDITLLDGAMPYRNLPVYAIAPSYFLGTAYGYTPLFDLIPLQDAVNMLKSTILTNQSAFGIQNLLVPQGSNVSISQLTGALNIIEANTAAGEIRPLNLTQTPKEIFDYIMMLEKDMETISGVNSVARGNPDPNLRSGNALALVQSMTLQYISGLQQSYVNMIEDIGTGLINILKDHANVPRIATIVGKNNRTELKEFKGDDLSGVNRVVVDIGNPLARTTAGRVEMAEQLLQMNAIKTPEQYFSVINTGQLDVMTESIQDQLFLVKSENERLVDFKPVIAVFTDEHAMHIKEHATVLSDPEYRFNHQLVDAVSAHIQEHINLLSSTNPNVLGILGQQALQPQGQPQPMPNGQLQGQPTGENMPQPEPPPMNQDQNPVLNNPNNQMLEQQGLPPINLSLPKVDPQLLANPELQQTTMGNVQQPQ